MLFDKYDRLNLAELSESEAWRAVNEFENWVYRVADSMGEDEYFEAISMINGYRDDYYRLFES
jgi:hypothetical protein